MRVLFSSALLFLAASVRAQEACTPWAGEIDPLPTTQSADPFEARWAALRARELETIARALEADQPVIAQRLRMHVRCLDPGVDAPSGDQLASLAPTISYRSRPFVIRPKPEPAPPREETPRADYAEVDRTIEQAEGEIAEARFKVALDLADQARGLLEAQPTASGRSERIVKLEVMAATALIALGRSEDAADSFARALEAKPDLQLDEETTPPKILRLFARIRERDSGASEARR